MLRSNLHMYTFRVYIVIFYSFSLCTAVQWETLKVALDTWWQNSPFSSWMLFFAILMSSRIVAGAVSVMTRLAHCPLQSGTSCFCIYHSSFPVDWWLSLNSFLWLERERTSWKDVSSVVEFQSRSFALKVYIERQISSFSCRSFDSVWERMWYCYLFCREDGRTV